MKIRKKNEEFKKKNCKENKVKESLGIDDPFLLCDINGLPSITLAKKDEIEIVNDTSAQQHPIPLCHNIVSTSQIISSMKEIDLQRLASLFPFTSYDRKRFAAITIRLANPHCTCLLFGSGKLVITGSTSFHACIVASQTITEMLRDVNLRYAFLDNIILLLPFQAICLTKRLVDRNSIFDHCET